jgi:tyrosyl-tRNA synthetase
MDSKKALAKRIVTDFHSAEAAVKAGDDWAQQFQKGGVPDDIEEVTVEAPSDSYKLDKLLAKVGLADSGTDAGRKLKQNSVKVNGETVNDPTKSLPTKEPVTLQVGRKIKKVKFEQV